MAPRVALVGKPRRGRSVPGVRRGVPRVSTGSEKGCIAMDLRLTGKTALITGGSKGIGRATAEVLAGEGCNVILVAREQATLDEAAAAIRAKRQVNVRTIATDLSSDAAVRKVAAEAGDL